MPFGIEKALTCINISIINAFGCEVKAAFHSVEVSDWTGNPLLMCENVAVILNRMSRVTNILLSKIQSARKNLLKASLNDVTAFKAFI